jgi:hypothetical protein
MAMEENIRLSKGDWLLVKGPHTIVPTLLQITTRLAEHGKVRVIDGGFLYNPLLINSLAGGRQEVLKNIKVSQAEDCHELFAFLEDMPSSKEPFIVLDLLSLFFDAFVHIDERRRLLGLSLRHLDRLARGSGGLVSIHLPYTLSQTAGELVKMVEDSAKESFRVRMAARTQFSMHIPPLHRGV